jgi:hypothetical protein
MRTRTILAVLLTAAAASPAAQAQNFDPRVEVESRLKAKEQIPWDNLIGLIGLFGLLGLKPHHSDDSYHPASLE